MDCVKQSKMSNSRNVDGVFHCSLSIKFFCFSFDFLCDKKTSLILGVDFV